MPRITPRTCLWPMTGCLCIAFALSIGLTYRSNHHCFAGTCGEWLFPLQARIHVILWYLWITISVTVFSLRVFHPSVRKILSQPTRIPGAFASNQWQLGHSLLVLWVFALYGALIGNWWTTLRDYFEIRGRSLPGNTVVAAVALTGHVADVTMGMVLLPVSRHSALASFFKISPDATYTFHMTQAYMLFALVFIHGVLYASWAGVYSHNSDLFRRILPVLNPTYLYNEVWPGNSSALGIWRASLIFTGIISSLIMVAMFVTSFPTVRRKHFNLFYFTHLVGIVAVIVICLHASTLLYCTLPGLMMWLLDWSMRLFELRNQLDGRLAALGNGWYSLTVSIPRKRVTGCACDSPLAHFYIHHSGSSIRELHPFTTVTHLSSKRLLVQEGDPTISIQFLFRQSVLNNSPQALSQPPLAKSTQWTNRLGSLVDEEDLKEKSTGDTFSRTDTDNVSLSDLASRKSTNVKIRLEGPYFTPAHPESFETIICLVAGTGLSGAIAIAAAFKAQREARCVDLEGKEQSAPMPCTGRGAAAGTWQRCIVIWTVRERDFVDMPFFSALNCDGFEFRVQKTGAGLARPDTKKALDTICGAEGGRKTWCYMSGPDGYMTAMEQACGQVKGLTWFAARWG